MIHSNLGPRFWNVITGVTSQLAHSDQQAINHSPIHTHTHTHTHILTLSHFLSVTSLSLYWMTRQQSTHLSLSSSYSSCEFPVSVKLNLPYFQSPSLSEHRQIHTFHGTAANWDKYWYAFRISGAPPLPSHLRTESHRPLSIRPEGVSTLKDQHKHVLRSSCGQDPKDSKIQNAFPSRFSKSFLDCCSSYTHT